MYLWNAATGDIVQLCQTATPDCYVGSVAWIKEGNYVALGDSNGVVQVGATVSVNKLYHGDFKVLGQNCLKLKLSTFGVHEMFIDH